jgi:GT2 family glycosyltransferase
VAADAVRRHGLPIADYFLWNDDFEYTCRLLRRGKGIVVPASVVEHRTARFGDVRVDPGERFYYEVRNKLWLFVHSRVLRGVDWLAYAGATVRRWLVMLLTSRRRRVLLRAGWRGLQAGLWRGPQPSSRVLAGCGPVSREVVLLDAGADSR